MIRRGVLPCAGSPWSAVPAALRRLGAFRRLAGAVAGLCGPLLAGWLYASSTPLAGSGLVPISDRDFIAARMAEAIAIQETAIYGAVYEAMQRASHQRASITTNVPD